MGSALVAQPGGLVPSFPVIRFFYLFLISHLRYLTGKFTLMPRLANFERFDVFEPSYAHCLLHNERSYDYPERRIYTTPLRSKQKKASHYNDAS